MALIIKGKMPTCCGSCRASGTDVCKSWFGFLKHVGEGRPIGCPIIGEIPDKHGRLIEADEVDEAISESLRNGEITGGSAGLFTAIVHNASTIVPSTVH